MAEVNTCPQCGKALTGETPGGLCPACLLKRGLETNTQGFTRDEPQGSGWSPPEPKELAVAFSELDIIELIGRGGMGAVYKARQKDLDRLVALKILPPQIGSQESFAQRFAREAQAMARLSHPNIVTIHSFGSRPLTAGGQRGDLYFFIMEYVDGLSLRQILDAGTVSPKEALAIVPQICDALQYAHDRGIVHRDIKPENILLNRAGQVKIADFGLAKLVSRGMGVSPMRATGVSPVEGDQEHGRDAHATQHVMGTPRYMAPEQMLRPSEVDHRADIYSLGVVFYQMLTGELPHGGEKFGPPSRKVLIDVRLDEVVLRALQREPTLRYQQVSQVKEDVETIVHTSAAPGRRPESSTSDAREQRHREEYERRAPGWIIRCKTCGFTEPWGKYGVRLMGRGRTLTIGWCRRCRWIRCHVVEQGEAPAKQPENIPKSRRLPLVGVRDGRRVICWSVLLMYLVFLAVPIGTAWTISASWRAPLIFSLALCAILVVGILRGWAVPIEQLPLLESKLRPTLPPPRPDAKFSRLAIVGAVWAVFAVAAFLRLYQGPSLWQIALAILILPLGFTAPLGTTICGAVGISRIRRSGGMLCGLRLAVADVLIFPLLAMDAVIWAAATYGAYGVRSSSGDLDPWLWVWLLASAAVCAVADVLVIRWAWRAANRPLGTPPAPAAPPLDAMAEAPPAAPLPTVDYARQLVKAPAVGLIIAAAINLALLAALGAVSLTRWNSALPRVQVQETARDSSYKELPDTPRPVAQVTVSRGESWAGLVVGAAMVPSIIVLVAAIRMLRLRGRGLAIAGSILAMIAAPGNIIGLPFGIWALVVLNKREVMEGFAAVRAQKVRSRAWVVILAVVGSLAVLAGAAGFAGVYLRDRMRASGEEHLRQAKRMALESDRLTINSQAELYKMQHNGRRPGIRDGSFDGELFVRQLTRPTSADGEFIPPGPEALYGPYLLSFPANPFVEGPAASRVKGGPGPSPNDGSSGWWVMTTTGEVFPNHRSDAFLISPQQAPASDPIVERTFKLPPRREAPVTQPAATRSFEAAETARAYAARIKTILPEGWSVAAEKAIVTVTRKQPVEWYGTISLPSQDKARLKEWGFIHSKTYTIGLEFAPPISAEEAGRLTKANTEITRKYYQAHPRQHDVKPGPMPEELTGLLHRVPDILAGDFSVFLAASIKGPGHEFSTAFYDDAVEAECARVEQGIRKILTGPASSATSVASVMDSLVAAVILIEKDYPELEGFGNYANSRPDKLEVRFSRRVRSYYEMRLTRPDDIEKNGIELLFAIHDEPWDAWTTAANPLLFLKALKKVVASSLVLSPSPSPGLEQKLAAIIAEHRAMLVKMDQSAATRPASRPLAVQIKADGTCEVEGRAVTAEQLGRKARDLLAADPRATVSIKAAKECKHVAVADVVDVLRQASVPAGSIVYTAISDAEPKPRPLVLRVARGGAMAVDGKSVTAGQWEKIVRQRLADDPRTAVGIKADEGVTHAELAGVVESLRKMGVVMGSVGIMMPQIVKEPAAPQSQPFSASAPAQADNGPQPGLIPPSDPLLIAVLNGDSAKVKKLLAAGAKVDKLDDRYGCTALHLAAREGQLEIMKILRKAGARIYGENRQGEPLTFAAVASGKTEVIRYLLQEGASKNSLDADGETLLHYAVSFRLKVDMLLYLIQQGLDLNARDNRGRTPLHLAALEDSASAHTEALVKAGADIKAADSEGRTPLHLAAEYDRRDVVATLVKAGADCNAPDASGRRPLHESKSAAVIAILLKGGAKPDVSDNDGQTPLSNGAFGEDRVEMARLLINAGADVNHRGDHHRTAIFDVISRDDVEMFALLVEHGAIMTLKDDAGETPRDWIKEYDVKRIGKYLADKPVRGK
ncbi:MAG: ankyrin repeat domain-containing protein [Planctomycetaceae bacterium]|nr:ankyrin repeat domain-containing protein [Planctomycetaceae bacterium]